MKKRNGRRLAAALAAACLLARAAAPASAASHAVAYNGDHKIVTSGDLNLFGTEMMPGGSSVRTLWLRNDSGSAVNVYVRAESVEGTDFQKKLLGKLPMTISVKVGTGQDLIRYDGVASGVVRTTVSLIPSQGSPNGLLLGRLSPFGAADMTVKLSAPESLGNEYQDAAAAVRWVFTCDAEQGGGNGNGGGAGDGGNEGGGNGGGTASAAVPTESIPEDGPPLAPAGRTDSSAPGASRAGTEIIPDEEIPLIDAPGTGPKTGDESSVPLLAALCAASGLCAALLLRRRGGNRTK